MSTLEARKRKKIPNTSPILRIVFNMEVDFFIGVISSLGAVPSFAVNTVSKLLKCQN
jgi:hypothetical protein